MSVWLLVLPPLPQQCQSLSILFQANTEQFQPTPIFEKGQTGAKKENHNFSPPCQWTLCEELGTRTCKSVQWPRLLSSCWWGLSYLAWATTQPAGFLPGNGGDRGTGGPSGWAQEVWRRGSHPGTVCVLGHSDGLSWVTAGWGLWVLWPSVLWWPAKPEQSRHLHLVTRRKPQGPCGNGELLFLFPKQLLKETTNCKLCSLLLLFLDGYDVSVILHT